MLSLFKTLHTGYFQRALKPSEPEKTSSKATSTQVRIYTHNIRYDNGALWENEKPWSIRREYVASSIQFNARGISAVVTLQEALHNQVEDLVRLLGLEWTYYGIGREDGVTRGEYSPIFWKKTEWDLLNHRTFWLSETPDRPSKGWDAGQERIVTWVHLKHKVTGQRINVFSTHFDDRGVEARRESTKLIIEKTKDVNNDPCFLGGDFNTEPVDEPYQIAQKYLDDASQIVEGEIAKYGYYSGPTYTGFDGGIRERAKIIDYIWCEQEGKRAEKGYNLRVEGYGILRSKFNGVYISDHRPVVADVVIGEDTDEARDYVMVFGLKEKEPKRVIAV